MDSVESEDPYNADDDSLHDRVHRPSCYYARRSNSYASHPPGSQSTLRRHPFGPQSLYNSAPINEPNLPGPGYASPSVEGQLPNYVVPVLYTPQRIMTNEELYSSDIVYNQYAPPEQGSFQPSYQGGSYDRTFIDKPTSVSRHRVPSRRRFNMHEQLTDSETEMYDKLMAKLYGMERSEKELAVDNAFSKEYSAFQASLAQVPENEPNRNDELLEYSNPPNSNTSMASQHIGRRMKASSFTQEYATKPPTVGPPRSTSTADYAVYSMQPLDCNPHKPVKDLRMANLVEPKKSSYAWRNRNRESLAKLSRPIVTPFQGEQNFFNSDLDFTFRVETESKCTQTSADMGTETYTGDCRAGGTSETPEKGPTKAKTYDYSSSDVTAVNDRGSDENLYRALNGGSSYSKLQQSKFDKSTECFPTVDLLPVESSTINSMAKDMAASKLSAHSRPPRVPSYNKPHQ